MSRNKRAFLPSREGEITAIVRKFYGERGLTMTFKRTADGAQGMCTVAGTVSWRGIRGLVLCILRAAPLGIAGRRVAVFWLLLAAFWVMPLSFAVAQTVERGWLGIEVQDLTPKEAEALGVGAGEGEQAGRGAAHGVKAISGGHGIQPGDIILSIDRRDIKSKAEFDTVISESDAGDTVRLRLLREGSRRSVNVTLAGRLPSGQADRAPGEDMPGRC
jgi:hypothetical protein